jgi:hypothetical protein
MLAKTENLATVVENWLAQFEAALAQADHAALDALFHAECYWRDALALTWDLVTFSGADVIATELIARARRAAPTGFTIDPRRMAPRHVRRAGTNAIEAMVSFETAEGRANGVVRLIPAAGDGVPKAWTLFTGLDELKGHEERVGKARPTGQSYSRDFRGPNWLDLRKSAAEYADRDPAVLVVGGGQAGLSIAARLTQLGIDTLIVDREPRVGDNWRKRYHALTLHNQVHVNHLPYMPFPPNWPTYIPKDKLAGWFAAYVEAMELNYWTGTEFERGAYDEDEGRWSVTLKRDGTTRTLRPRHVVLATGVSGIPSIPVEDCDLLATSMPVALVRKSHIRLTEQSKQLDREILDGLTRAGFKLDYGDDGSGWQFKYLTRGGGYYFNVGCSDLVASREIALAQFSAIAEVVPQGARMQSGETLAADLIVLATGYKGQEHLVRKLFGDEVAARVGPIWGFGPGDELRNMYVRTPQPGLWFIAGSLAQCRIYSKYLGLQIKASEIGMRAPQ